MMEQTSQSRSLRWPAIAALVAIAAALGFGAAHWMGQKNIPSAVPTAALPTITAPAAEAENSSPDIKIPDEYLAVARIAVELVTSGNLQTEIVVNGTVTAPPNNEAIIIARASGTISRVHRQLGDTVKAGEKLAQVDSQEATTMAAERQVANAKAELARKNYARESSLFAQGVTPRQDLEAAQSALAVAEAEAQRATSLVQSAHVSSDGKSVAVLSPIAGKITAHMATLGAYAQPQAELFRVAGNGPVQVAVSVPAADIGRVRVGDSATITGSGDAQLNATVRAVTSTVSSDTHAATVILVPTSMAHSLIVGEGVQARLHVKAGVAGAEVVMVPEDAVQNIDGHDVLFVRVKGGFRVQAVLVGQRGLGLAQIVSGIGVGEAIATRNAFLIKADMIKSTKDE